MVQAEEDGRGGVPISGLLLCEKAVNLSRVLNGETDFTASKGGVWRFCQRHGIRQPSLRERNCQAMKSKLKSSYLCLGNLSKQKDIPSAKY